SWVPNVSGLVVLVRVQRSVRVGRAGERHELRGVELLGHLVSEEGAQRGERQFLLILPQQAVVLEFFDLGAEHLVERSPGPPGGGSRGSRARRGCRWPVAS